MIILRCLKSRMFWIGAQTVLLLNLISEFIERKSTWQHTAIWGVILILNIAWDRLLLEKEEME